MKSFRLDDGRVIPYRTDEELSLLKKAQAALRILDERQMKRERQKRETFNPSLRFRRFLSRIGRQY